MKIEWIFENADDFLRATLPRSFDAELPALERILAPLQPERRTIRIFVDAGTEPGVVELRAVASLPLGALVAEASGTEPQRALQQLAEELRVEAKAHVERIRAEAAARRRGQRRQELGASAPLLERDVQSGRRERFFHLLRPVLASLRGVARHELRILEIEQGLAVGELTTDDLVDEVITLAWDRFADRPRDKDLDAWLVELLHEVILRWRREPVPISLAEPHDEVGGVAPPEPHDWETERDDQGRLHLESEEPDTSRLHERLLDEEGFEPWEQVDTDEQARRMLSILADLPAERRQAWLLFAVERYTSEEIATIQ